MIIKLPLPDKLKINIIHLKKMNLIQINGIILQTLSLAD